MDAFQTVFYPLLIVMDPIGTTVIFAALTSGTARSRKTVMVFQALVTALLLGLAFTFFGHVLLQAIGVDVADLQIAGGIVLLWMSLQDIVREKEADAASLPEQFGVVPLGTPLIIGPGAITTLLMHSRLESPVLCGIAGLWPVLAALAANLVIVGACLFSADRLMRLMGRSVATAVSKVFMLILAAYSVMMIRFGALKIIASLDFH